MSQPHSPFNRRKFLRRSLAAGAFGLAPQILPARLLGPLSPSNRLNVGLVGLGLICGSHRPNLLRREEVRIVGICDVWKDRREKVEAEISSEYGKETPGGKWTGTRVAHEYEELLADPGIDVIFVLTPDHWHAPIANAAMKAGKDVYCEKPLTLTVAEGRVLVNTARRYGRVLQTGTQQRSEAAFRKAAEIVRNGWIGRVRRIKARLGHFPPGVPLPEQPVPAGFDYDRWVGPTPWHPYHEDRVKGNYGGGWRNFFEFGGRKNGDWGAHHFDIIQWALGKDDSGPVEFIPAGYGGRKYQTHIYADGTVVERVDETFPGMIEFQGTEGRVNVARDGFLQTDPVDLALRPLAPGDQHLTESSSHHDNFFACVRNRQRPISDVEIGHRSATVCHLNNIAFWLQRPIRWDPGRETIVGDAEAARLLDRPRRAPYNIL